MAGDATWKQSGPPSPTTSTASRTGAMGGSSWTRWGVVRWFRSRVIDPLVSILSRGAEPKQISLSAALGFTMGIFPIYGATAVLCAGLALLLQSSCNLPTMMLANFIATPVELSLVIPFMRFGEKLVGAEPLDIAPKALFDAITGHGSSKLLHGVLHAILGWAVASPFVVCILYLVFVPIFTRLSWRFSSGFGRRSPPATPVAVMAVSSSGSSPARTTLTSQTPVSYGPLHVSRRA
ncbi:hypothetical protein CBR_g61487 [Chara braunii]|uniref:DUF2062 domain-containing protein n=1 Tax=Chara braunii TaxID=69332 RepID=A0A388K8P5_CHABU|nr:hypothetical protein CBR_g61487 [Chara braunii]|eukprot:GBG66444.1 hypothetical protein CBR_g61487 [Chara braunii]